MDDAGLWFFLSCLLWWLILWVASGFGLTVYVWVVSLVSGCWFEFLACGLWIVGFRMVTGGLVGLFSFGVVLLVVTGFFVFELLAAIWANCGCLWLGFAEVFGYAVVWGWYFVGLGLRLVWVCGFACGLICGWFGFGACWWSD